jgi:hypothetical protein
MHRIFDLKYRYTVPVVKHFFISSTSRIPDLTPELVLSKFYVSYFYTGINLKRGLKWMRSVPAFDNLQDK